MKGVREPLLSALERAKSSSDPAVWIHLASEGEILREAAVLEERLARGEDLPLAGMPFGVKDNIDVAGWPTTAACPDFAYTPAADATAVARLRSAGAVPLGKTNLDQFATGLVGTRSPYGAVRNVFSREHISGGSSSGSAAAVALGHVPFALGTDTAGSGRIPAAFGNLVGLKPTRGVWSAAGVVPACRSLDCVSVFSKGTSLARTVWRCVAGQDALDPYSRPMLPSTPRTLPATFRFGVPRGGVPFVNEQLWTSLWTDSVTHLKSLGGTPVETDFAPFQEVAALLYDGPWIAERWADLGAFAASHADSLHPTTRIVLDQGRSRTAAEVYDALHRLEALLRAVETQFRGFEVLMLPTAGRLPTLAEVAADPLGVNSELGKGTNFCNLLDLSALSLPSGFDGRGLPFGITLFAPAFHDLALLELGDRWTGVPTPAPLADPDRVRVAVAGLHLSGEPLNHELTARGGRLESNARTSAAYRCYRIRRGDRQFPGLVRTGDGVPTEVEIWSLPAAGAGTFLRDCVRPPLCLGTVELEDGTTAIGFLGESWAVEGMEDITARGGWRAANTTRT
jgi:allophanate hydrolase